MQALKKIMAWVSYFAGELSKRGRLGELYDSRYSESPMRKEPFTDIFGKKQALNEAREDSSACNQKLLSLVLLASKRV